MFCHNCGKKIEDNATHCAHCNYKEFARRSNNYTCHEVLRRVLPDDPGLQLAWEPGSVQEQLPHPEPVVSEESAPTEVLPREPERPQYQRYAMPPQTSRYPEPEPEPEPKAKRSRLPGALAAVACLLLVAGVAGFATAHMLESKAELAQWDTNSQSSGSGNANEDSEESDGPEDSADEGSETTAEGEESPTEAATGSDGQGITKDVGLILNAGDPQDSENEPSSAADADLLMKRMRWLFNPQSNPQNEGIENFSVPSGTDWYLEKEPSCDDNDSSATWIVTDEEDGDTITLKYSNAIDNVSVYPDFNYDSYSEDKDNASEITLTLNGETHYHGVYSRNNLTTGIQFDLTIGDIDAESDTTEPPTEDSSENDEGAPAYDGVAYIEQVNESTYLMITYMNEPNHYDMYMITQDGNETNLYQITEVTYTVKTAATGTSETVDTSAATNTTTTTSDLANGPM